MSATSNKIVRTAIVHDLCSAVHNFQATFQVLQYSFAVIMMQLERMVKKATLEEFEVV